MTRYQSQLALDVCALLIDGPEGGTDGAYRTYVNGFKCLLCNRPLMKEKGEDAHQALCPMRKVYQLKYWAEAAEGQSNEH